ncbi:hypothetical protein [Nereida sp. MMG025]|uniref:hypothetical protein n=1 Tax=Nereida sp. MMG025 TaxID=2909981 RepID=UPI001F1FED90|nr:hypothetical protein [Nereida sp. MMG025]MCF6445468.1 hypothetical protein [Nereida sp. MMG025]
MSIHTLYWGLVGMLGIWMGWRRQADDAYSVGSVARASGIALAWCAAAQIILALAYMGVVTNGGVLDAPLFVLRLAMIASFIWAPLVVIGVLSRNAKERMR